MAITPPVAPVAPPPAPDRADRATFSARATASFDHLKEHSTPELYALALNAYGNAGEVVTLAGQAATSASNASTSASNAAASAASAANSPGTSATSSTTLSVSVGAKSLVIQTGKAFSTSQQIVIGRTSAPATRMFARIDAYNAGTGALDVTVLAIEGTGGPFSDWTISLGVATPAASRGTGGASIAGNQTLTAGSAAVQTITPTGPGQWVRLPAATTLNAGVPVFDLQNAGAWDVEIQDNTGAALGYIANGATVGVSLRDASTAAGAWALRGHTPYGIISTEVGFALSLGSANTGQLVQVIELDATRDMLIYAGDARMYAQIWDGATSTFGTPVLVRAAGIYNARGIKSATDQVLLFSDSAGTVQGVVLSVSGAAITVNTAASVSPGNNNIIVENLIAVAGQGFAVSLNRTAAGIQEVRAVTISGTTVTIGSALTLAVTQTNPPGSLFDMGSSRVLWIIDDGSGGISCRPYTVSGSTVTLGTVVSLARTSAQYMARMLASGRVAVVFEAVTTGYLAGAIVTVTGTVATQSTVTLDAQDISNSLGVRVAYAIGSQVIVADYTAANTTTVNVLTDNAGTAVAGTALLYSTNQAPVTMVAVDATSVTLHFASNSSLTSAVGRVAQYGISGNNPVVLASRVINTTNYVNGGISPSTTANPSFGKDQLQLGMLRGSYGSLAGLTPQVISTLWHTPKALPNFIPLPAMQTFGTTTDKTRSASGNFEWQSSSVNAGGLLLNVQRVKVA